MRLTRTGFTLLVLLLLPALATPGCGGGDETPQEPAEPTQGAEPAPEGGGARTLAIPRGSQMPADHPAPEQARSVPLVWDAPEGWVAEKPASSMRMAQYRAPGSAGDGECLVFYFGRGQGGDPMSNARRWAGQFLQSDGSSSESKMQVTRLEGTQVPVMIVEVTGTYNGGMTMTDAPAEESPGWMLLGGIAEGSDAPWFFKFTGPEATVREQREAFVGMMESIRTGS